METPRREQDEHNDAERAPGEESADGGNGDSGQQMEHTSGDEQSEKQPEEPLKEQDE